MNDSFAQLSRGIERQTVKELKPCFKVSALKVRFDEFEFFVKSFSDLFKGDLTEFLGKHLFPLTHENFIKLSNYVTFSDFT